MKYIEKTIINKSIYERLIRSQLIALMMIDNKSCDYDQQ
jgi:hypothetical protein